MKKFYISFFLFLISFLLHSQDFIFHVEPPNWWVGMNSSKLKLMVHGDNIANYEVSINDERIKLKQVKKVENKRYLFLDIEILDNSNSFEFEITFSKEGKIYEKYNYRLLQKNKERNTSFYLNSSDVIYLINADRFANGNQENDFDKSMNEKNVNRKKSSNRHGGDLQGVINHLDYIDDMGFTALAISSVLENNIDKNSFESNAVTDFYKVDSRLGGNEIYKELSLESHNRGFKLVKEILVNHVGINHWWVDDPPFEDWINPKLKNQILSSDVNSIFDPYADNKDNKSFTDSWIDDSHPDLNHKNKFLSNYLIQNTIWWIEFAQLSAIKVDYYSNVVSTFTEKLNLSIQKEYPGFRIIGESFLNDKSVIGLIQQKPYQKQINNKTSFILPSMSDLPMQLSLISSLNSDKDMKGLYQNIGQDYLYPNPVNMCIFLDNQNTSRCFYLLKHNLSHWKMAQAFLFVNRGIPQVLYGTEVLMTDTLNPANKSEVLSDFPGGWNHDKKDAFQNKLSSTEKEAQDFIKILLNWRKNCSTIHDGNLKHFSPVNNSDLYSLIRYDKNRIVLLVLNNTNQKKKINPEYYFEKSGSRLINKTAINILTKDEVEIDKDLFIPSDSFLLLDLYF